MANQIHIYTNNPTSAGTDGTLVSEENAMTTPISAILAVTAATGASKAVKCAVRCDAGYAVSGDTVIKVYKNTNGTYTDDYAGDALLCVDNSYADGDAALAGGSFSTSITLTRVVSTNMIFWVKRTAVAGATPVNDKTAALHVIANGVAATA